MWRVLALGVLAACTPRPADRLRDGGAPDTAIEPAAPALRLRFIDDFNLPPGLVIDGVAVGGLSGLTYDAPHVFALSDGHRHRGPPRIYRLGLSLVGGDLSLAVEAQIFLHGGGRFDPARYDAEGLAAVAAGWLVSTEGDRDLAPAIDLFDRDGAHRRRLEVPRRLAPHEGRGTRPNRGLEGLSVQPDGAAVAAMEEALLQDGAPATATAGTCVRLVRYDPALSLAGELAYCTDPLPPGPVLSGDRLAMVGVSALAFVDARRLLVLERTGVEREDRFDNRVRIYAIDPTTAPDVRGVDRIGEDHAAPKRLVLDFDDIAARLDPPKLDNFEAMTLGPLLPSGERTLLVVSDDNFSPSQRTAFVAFALEE